MIAVYSGEDVVRRFIELIGPTDPAKAPKCTIRGKHCTDSLDRALAEGRPLQNGVHRSDSEQEASREIRVWYFYLGTERYDKKH